jgi:hypothetical protein
VRGVVSVLLLLIQFQPLVGVALCQGLANAEASPMEDGCPMPEAISHRVSERAPEPPSGSTLAPAGSVHDCAFSEACLNASPTAVPAMVAFRLVAPPHDQSFRTMKALHGSEELPPPIPPPNF